ncbi:hypothetical protein HDU76_009543, partial [Blyttiomyces sp. JEL0837]
MTFSLAHIPDLTNKVAIVTGGTAGLGLETVIELARKNCHVITTARSIEKGEQTLTKVHQALSPSLSQSESSKIYKVEYILADNENLDSITEFAAKFLEKKLPLHMLICNAGIFIAPYKLIHG